MGEGVQERWLGEGDEAIHSHLPVPATAHIFLSRRSSPGVAPPASTSTGHYRQQVEQGNSRHNGHDGDTACMTGEVV